MFRFLIPAAAALLFSSSVLAQQSVPSDESSSLDTVTPEQRRITEEIVRDYILRNPEIVLEAIRILQAREEAAANERGMQALAANAAILRDDPRSPVAGNPTGDVSIVEFFDYACPYCRNAHPVLTQLLEEDASIRVVYKEYPILGEASVFASRVAVAVHLLQPDLYLPYHKRMFEVRGRLSPEAALQVAAEVGVERTRLLEILESDEVTEILNSNIRLAQAIGVNGTPGFVIGDSIVPGLLPIEQLRDLIEGARENCSTCQSR